jgi:hypothetical protein
LVCFGSELGVSRAFPESYQKCDPVSRKPAGVAGCMKHELLIKHAAV